MRLHKLHLVFLALGFICVNSHLLANAATVTKGYKDVPKTHWAKDSVVKMVDEYQFMAGDPSGNFAGGRALTRYEFAKTMANMVEYYNHEIETDRKDLENVVGVLELFQIEMRKMETKVSQAEEQVQSQNATIAELNELIVTIGDELNGVGESGTTQEELLSLKTRVAAAELDIDKLSDKGFMVDTLIKGVGNDAKHLGHAVASVTRKMSPNREAQPKETITTETTNIETTTTESSSSSSVDAELTAPAQESVKPVATPADIDDFVNKLDGYYAAPAVEKEEEKVEYLTPINQGSIK